MRGEAVIIGDYRYLLWREWDCASKTVAFIMKNYSHLYCFGMTKKGCPRHPLYLHHTSQLQIFS